MNGVRQSQSKFIPFRSSCCKAFIKENNRGAVNSINLCASTSRYAQNASSYRGMVFFESAVFSASFLFVGNAVHSSDLGPIEQDKTVKIEETLQLAAEIAGVGTWNLVLPKNELRSSPKCREIFGLTTDAPFQYEDFLASLHPDDKSMVKDAVTSALDPAGTGQYEVDYRIIHPNGSVRWIGAKGRAFFEGLEGSQVATRLIGTVIDRTERRKIQDALIESERLAVTGRLAASIAHEIRNPVDAVINLLYVLRSEASKAKRDEYIEEAGAELNRVTEIANNTLRFYRDPAGVTAFDLSELAVMTLNLFRGRIAASAVTVENRLPSGTLVSAAQGELRQVIVNLVTNALDAMPRGGRLILRTRRLLNHHNGRSCIRLTVADTGVGMPSEVRERIFEAFYTTKGAAGNGLGLWLSLEIMKKCGSSMRVRSAVGRGTVFHFFLDAVDPSPN